MEASKVTSEQKTLCPASVPAFGLAWPYSASPASFVARCSADVPQDRGLMPSDEEMGEALAYGVQMEIERTRGGMA